MIPRQRISVHHNKVLKCLKKKLFVHLLIKSKWSTIHSIWKISLQKDLTSLYYRYHYLNHEILKILFYLNKKISSQKDQST